MRYNILAKSWYTDRMKIVRTKITKYRGVDKQEEEVIKDKVPCHIYTTSKAQFNQTPTSSELQENNMLGCDVDVDIQSGDMIEVTRHGVSYIEKYLVGKPLDKIEPFARIAVGLTHKEVPIFYKGRITL